MTLATKSENAEIAVLQSQMETTTTTLGRVEGKVDSLIVKIDTIALLQQELSQLKDEIVEIKKGQARRDALIKWTIGLIVAISGVIGTLTLALKK